VWGYLEREKEGGEVMAEVLIGLREAASGVRIVQVVGACLVRSGLSSPLLGADVGCSMTQPPSDARRIACGPGTRAGVRPLHAHILKRR
jgi:hypothetical protein